jgi:1,4-alpha-glucan branching enzyme
MHSPCSAPGREAEEAAGIGYLAIVLHSHMPYVEGFGTYPFGEEWLFDAACRAYLPVLEVAEQLTVTITPVLADQLEAPGVGERMIAFVREHRLGAAEADARDLGGDFEAACRGEARRYRGALDRLEALGGNVLDAFRDARDRGLELIPSAATHAVLPLLATHAGRRLQIDAGLRSHGRRFGDAGGFWLPECAFDPGLDLLLAERELRFFCVDQTPHEQALDALAPIASPAGPVAFPIDWEAISWLWSLDGYPSSPEYADFYRGSMRGVPVWAIDGAPYHPDLGAATARCQANEFVVGVADRLRRYRDERGRRGLLTFAIDTELLGHWWREGPVWLQEVIRAAPEAALELVTLSEGLRRVAPEPRPLYRATWGEGKDLRTWDSPEVADLAWAARRLELRLLRALGTGLRGAEAVRAARELLAVQASDWAFLDKRGQAGDYPYQRAIAHGKALLDAIHSAPQQRGSSHQPPEESDPTMRNLAPDLSLAPLFEP